MGWVHRRRDHGGVIFIDLRDRDGVTQVVFHEDVDAAVHERAEEVRAGIRGRRRRRGRARARRRRSIRISPPAKSKWSRRRSGSSTNRARRRSRWKSSVDVAEDARLKYRYVDLRRPHMQRNIILRSKIAFAVREELYRPGLPRNRNAVHDALHAGRRARLPGAQPRAARHLLRAAAIAADLQAAADGQRLRKVFPDRPLLPRRRPARRPPAGVHPDRSRDVASRSRSASSK